jgi:hypothetical protein
LQLKEDFVGTKQPITDDNQILQKFCAKLEQLLRYEMKGGSYIFVFCNTFVAARSPCMHVSE